jgi:hypothetical protein
MKVSLLAVDHEKLTYRYAGRDFRLTDVHGRVVEEVLAEKLCRSAAIAAIPLTSPTVSDIITIGGNLPAGFRPALLAVLALTA